MLEICVSGFLVISVSVSLLLWRCLAVAKQADYRIRGRDGRYMIEPWDETAHLTKLIPSPND